MLHVFHFNIVVFEELQIMTKLHFQALQCLLKEEGLPVLKQHLAKSKSGQRTTSSGSTGRSRYPSSGAGHQTQTQHPSYQTPQYDYAQY